MQIQVRYYAEITIKSRPVRKRLCRRLAANLRRQLRGIDPHAQVSQGWDRILIDATDGSTERLNAVFDCLARTSGIAYFSEIETVCVNTLEDIVAHAVSRWAGRLRGCSFAVRCRRRGDHQFGSLDVERAVGAALLASAPDSRVDLTAPAHTVRLEVREDRLMLAGRRREGQGGYPAGCFEPVLSLVSGGFDSMVATWMSMRRGLLTHTCLLRLGGTEHEQAVEEIVHYLWLQYGGGVPMRFVSVPFESVLEDIVAATDPALTTIILKRQMLIAASRMASRLHAGALVTGECVGQVSSQTLRNLDVIDRATNMLILRPLAMTGKQEIIAMAKNLSIEAMVSVIPEYCGAVSSRPATSARLERVLREEIKLNDGLIDAALADARVSKVSLLGQQDPASPSLVPPLLSTPAEGDIVIDIRHPLEIDRRPLRLDAAEVLAIPFYTLAARFGRLAPEHRYLLYCEQGVMSRLQAQHLADRDIHNVAVLRPELSRVTSDRALARVSADQADKYGHNQ